MNKIYKIIFGIMTTSILACFLALSLTYARLREIPKHEIWRTMDYSRIDDLTIADNLLLFEALKKDELIDSHCVYAVDKTTGQFIWSTEQLAQPHIKEKELDTSWMLNWRGIVDIVSVSPQDHIVYITINFETFYALDFNDGRPIWKIDNIDGLNLFDSNFSDDQFFVMDKQGNLLVLDKLTGNKLWEQPIYQDLENESAQVSFHNNMPLVEVDFVNSDKILAFESKAGQKIWETDIRDYCCPRLFSANMVITANTGNSDRGSFLAGFDIATGNDVWEQHFDEQYLTFSLPPLAKNHVYVMLDKSNDNHQRITRLIVLDSLNGKTIWEFNSDFSHGDISYFINNEIVYIGAEDGYVFAIDSDTGRELWKTFTSDFPSYFILNEGTLIVAMEEDSLIGLDVKTGQEKWKTSLDTETIFPQGRYNDQESEIRNHNDVLYLASEKPAIYAASSNNGEILWSWNHNSIIPLDRRYRMELLDNDIIYVVGGSRWFDYTDYGLFALKAEP